MDAKSALDALGVPDDLKGQRCLDVGAWDGPITFELEKRGAWAAALDIQDPLSVGFDLARRILGSGVTHYQGSVYELPYEELSNLDVVVFRGVYYHLKYPLLAFERIALSLRPGGRLYFEGEGFIDHAEALDGAEVPNGTAKFAQSSIPICLSYPNSYRGASNWSIPNEACLRSWLQTSGFSVEALHRCTEAGSSRFFGSATRTRLELIPEHPLYDQFSSE